jgi:glycosyltransferase involved in cell wall biosynthesis
MRILMPCYEYPPLGGGGSRVVDGLSRELVRQGHEVDVVTMAFRNLPRHEVVEGVQVHRVPCVRFKEHLCTMPEALSYLPGAYRKIRDLVGRNDYQVNHTHFILPDGWNAARAKRATGLPYVITAHGSDVPGFNPDRLRAAHRILAPLWHRVTRGAAMLVCPSRSIHELVERRNAALPTTIIPYGFEVGRYDWESPRDKRILVVTRLLKRKGVRFLLLALANRRLDHEVHIVGDGPELPELRRLSAGTKTRVVFHGWLDNRSEALTRLYESSEIFVLPSEVENFPVALMEAMTAGLAIVTTRDTGCHEVVGETARLVTPRSPEEIGAALAELTASPARCRELGRAARQRIERELSWPVVAERYVEVYRRHARTGDRAA